MAELREIQLAELECLKEIDRVCKENGIKYSLAYGSMLGAVRHKGFIPWDDDLDTYMSLEEFKRFKKCFKSDEFFLQTEQTDPESPFVIYKVRKNNTEMIERGLGCLNIHTGVWVDIFVYIPGPKTEFMGRLQYNMAKILTTYRSRTLSKKKCKENILQRIANSLSLKNALRLDAFIVKVLEFLGNKKSGYVMVFNNGTYVGARNKRNLIEKTIKYEFEGLWFDGIENYDEYLQRFYGKNYMIPKRYGGHTEDIKNAKV